MASIRVGVIDTGVKDHPDLARRWIGGYDFIWKLGAASGRDNDTCGTYYFDAFESRGSAYIDP